MSIEGNLYAHIDILILGTKSSHYFITPRLCAPVEMNQQE